MADVPSVPPAAPAQALQALTLALENLLVLEAPPQLTQPKAPVQVQGTVVAADPQTKQVTVETPQGKIVVQMEAQVKLALKAAVALVIVTDPKTQKTRVTLMPLVRQAAPATTNTAPLLKPAAPAAALPPLRAGVKIEALLLPKPSATAPAFSPAPQSAPTNIIRQLLATYLPKYAPPPAPGEEEAPAPLPTPEESASAPDLLRIATPRQTPTPRTEISSPQTPLEEAVPGFAAAPQTQIEEWIDAFIAAPPAPEEAPGEDARVPPPPSEASPDAPPEHPAPIGMRILKILPPETPPGQIREVLSQLPPEAQAAKVEAQTPRGLPLLRTEAGDLIAVRTPVQSPPTGAVVVFEEVAAQQEKPQDVPADAQIPADPVSEDGLREWRALKAIDRFLKSAAPEADTEADAPRDPLHAAAQAMERALPAPGRQLAPAALLFLAALRSGAIENWLGADTLKALRASGKKDLADRLTGDFDRFAAQSRAAAPGGEWRAVSIPLRHEGGLSQMQFYIRQQTQDGGGNGNGKAAPATRFLLNLSLSRMGEMQLDGYMHKKNFDIVLRTEEKLPFEMRQELMKRFAAGLDQVQMQGGISFQTRAQSWITPAADPRAGIVT